MIEGTRRKIKLHGLTVKMAKQKIELLESDDILETDISFNHPRLQLYQLIRRCHDYITTETDKNLASLGSTQAQYQVLRILDDLETVSMTKISKLLFRGKSNLTTLIDRMERDGLVQRVTLQEDRRVSNIAITQKGKKLHDKVAKYHRLFILQKLDGLCDFEVDDLLKLLEKTAHIINPDGDIFNFDDQEKDK
jgi:DNA-binding MarR family transcriptional regulator